MAEDSMALIELMQKADGGDFLRSLAEAVLQLLMEMASSGPAATNEAPSGSVTATATGTAALIPASAPCSYASVQGREFLRG